MVKKENKGWGKINKNIFTGTRNNIMMQYKGDFGKVEFDDDGANVF